MGCNDGSCPLRTFPSPGAQRAGKSTPCIWMSVSEPRSRAENSAGRGNRARGFANRKETSPGRAAGGAPQNNDLSVRVSGDAARKRRRLRREISLVSKICSVALPGLDPFWARNRGRRFGAVSKLAILSLVSLSAVRTGLEIRPHMFTRRTHGSF